MIVVTGGMFQGKTAFIRQNFFPEGNVPEGFVVNGKDASFEVLCSCGCVMHFELWIKREMEVRDDAAYVTDTENVPMKLAERVRELIRRNPELIVELQEMGCGVVPISREDRIYRECCGRIGCLLAGSGSRVYRVVCGLGQRLQ